MTDIMRIRVEEARRHVASAQALLVCKISLAVVILLCSCVGSARAASIPA